MDYRKLQIYRDISARTKGEIYIGISGPVRTGKSTFIKRFMEQLVLPNMEEGHDKEMMRDELPQSAGGRTITTTEPKFIPKDAATITLEQQVAVKVRLVDCVGFMVEGASGHMEDDAERLVKTPWSEEEIPFTKAAQIGTEKVIRDHATIGVVMTTDASFSEIPREYYIPAEEQTIREFQAIGKPFIVLLNTTHPYQEETLRLAEALSEKYGVKVEPVNCEQLKERDVLHILEEILYEFPMKQIILQTPKWVEVLPMEHPLKTSLMETARAFMEQVTSLRDLTNKQSILRDNDAIKRINLEQLSLSSGCAYFTLQLEDTYYYKMLSEVLQEDIGNEYQLMRASNHMAALQEEYASAKNALLDVRNKGYGVMMPFKNEITLAPPEVIKQGNKYGVRIKANSPSIHLIMANIETEIAPIVGTKEQAEDLVSYIQRDQDQNADIWDTNIFGKTVEQLVNDGIMTKLELINDESRQKLQETMQKIVNDTNGGMVCIII